MQHVVRGAKQGTCNGGDRDAAGVGEAALKPAGWLPEALQEEVVHHRLEVRTHIIKPASQPEILCTTELIDHQEFRIMRGEIAVRSTSGLVCHCRD